MIPLRFLLLLFFFIGIAAKFGGNLSTASSSTELKPAIEILCFVDSQSLKLFHDVKDNSKIEESIEYYYKAFWKNVNLYFASLNINIIVKSIIIGRNQADDNKFIKFKKNYINGNGISELDSLKSFGKYLYNNKSLRNHDIAIYLTQFDICQGYKTNNSCEIKIDVAVSNNKICKIDQKLKLSRSVAIVSDKKNIFTGVRNSVFAIGKLLGIAKDGEQGSKKCHSKDGHFMSGNTNFTSPYNFTWSSCSLKTINKKLNALLSSSSSSSSSSALTNEMSCMLKKTNGFEIDISTAPLPGQLMPVDDYCYKLTNYKYRHYDGIDCSELVCHYGNNADEIIMGAAIEGSWCWDEMRCSFGKCMYVNVDWWKEVDEMVPKPI